MAEPTPTRAPAPLSISPPALGSTADAVPYVPVSWLAVAAMSVAGLFALLLVVLGLVAFRSHRPLLEEELLVLAVVAIVLSFAARRVIRNSEGTRTGLVRGVDLPNAAWWTALVLGLVYVAYLFAIDFAIRQDAKGEVQRWADFILADDLTRAFYRTRDPGERAAYRADDADKLKGRWGGDYSAFAQSDLVRVVKRNPGACAFEVGGLREWSAKPTGVECTVSGTLTCPEGAFPVAVGLKAVDARPGAEGGGGRQWQVMMPSTGYVQRDQVRLTPYGWFVIQLEVSGGDVGRQFIAQCGYAREGRLEAVRRFTAGGHDPMLKPLTLGSFHARSAVLGMAGGLAWTPGPAYYERTAAMLYTSDDGKPPSDTQKEAFRTAWATTGIIRAGDRLQNGPPPVDVLAFTDIAVELRVPIEIPISQKKGDLAAARGWVVVACTDPEVVAEVKRLRDAAPSAPRTAAPPEDLRRKPIDWAVTRIETDMKVIRSQPPGGPGGPGGQ